MLVHKDSAHLKKDKQIKVVPDVWACVQIVT